MIEFITGENIKKYMSLLTEDEMLRIMGDMYVALGAYGSKTDDPQGVIVVEILPADIRIKKIYTLPEYRGRGVAHALLKIVSSETDGLPIRFYDPKDDNFLLDHGFRKKRTDHKKCEGILEDVEKVSIPGDLRSRVHVRRLDEMPLENVEKYAMSRVSDVSLSFPDYELSKDRFSGGSLIALSGDEICGSILFEEVDDEIIIRWFNAGDAGILSIMFSVFKTELLLDYDKKTRLCFFTDEDMIEDFLSKIMKNHEIKPVNVYTLEGRMLNV